MLKPVVHFGAGLVPVLTDADLLGAIVAGRLDAFEELYDRYHTIAYSIAYRMTADSGSAQDVIQDAFRGEVREALQRFRGREIQTTGDGFLATFDGPARAVRCALAIREPLATLGIQVRSGLHTGEIELTGDDIAGIAVHIAARICAMADSSEVLASSTVKDLVAGSGIQFVERGTRHLKGVPDDWRIFAAVE